MNGTGERQRCCITPSVTLRLPRGSPTDSAKRIPASRMCLGSHGCGSPTVRSRRRRRLMRWISSTAWIFYNLRQPGARQEKGRGRTPPDTLLFATRLLAAQHEQVQQRQQRGERRRDVRERRRRQYALGAVGLAAREDTVAGQDAVGPGRGIDLHRQRDHMEGEDPGEGDHGELDEQASQRRTYAQDDRQKEQRKPELPGEVDYREEPSPELHRQVARGALDGVPALVGRHAHPRDRVAPEVVLRKPHDLAPRVVVVGKLPGHRLDLHVGEVVPVQDHARRLRPGQPAGAHLLGILRIRTPHPERRRPGDEGTHDHHYEITAESHLVLLTRLCLLRVFYYTLIRIDAPKRFPQTATINRWDGAYHRLSFPDEAPRNIQEATVGGPAGGDPRRLPSLHRNGLRRSRARRPHRGTRRHALDHRDGALPSLGRPAGDGRGHPPGERPGRVRYSARHAPGAARLGHDPRKRSGEGLRSPSSVSGRRLAVS